MRIRTTLLSNLLQLYRLSEKPISRRTFVRYSATTLLAAQMARSKSFAKSRPASVTILGAGAAGLSAAYTLAKAGIPNLVYEARSRLGGRILTMANFNSEGMYAELGGEVLNSQDVNVLQIAKELKLDVLTVKSNSETLLSDVYFFNDRWYTPKDVLAAMPHLASVIDKDRAKFLEKGLPLVPTYKNSLGAQVWDQMSLRAYFQSLEKRGVDKWLVALFEVAFRGEYGLETHEQSALNFLVLISTDAEKFSIFGASDEAKRIRGGNRVFISALAEAAKPQTALLLEHRLVAIKDRTNYFELVFDQGGKTKSTRAEKIICTLPFSTLRHVEGIQSLGLTAVKKKAIAELGYGNAAKLLLGFKRRAWLQPFGNKPGSEANIFTDLPSRRFWDSTNMQAGEKGILTNFLSGSEGKSFAKGFVDRACKDLTKILPPMQGQFDGSHITHSWANDALSLGCYTCAKPGQYTTLFGCMGEPELNGRLLFAGEHCSLEWQGFIEGAVGTGIAAATSLMG